MKILRYLMSITLLISVSSCEKWVLDKKPLNIISDSDVFTDEALIEAYLTQVYAQMTIFANDVNGSGMQGDGYVAVFELNEVSDECLPQWRDAPQSNAYTFKYGNLNINGGLLDWWGYGTVRVINMFLQKISDSPLSPEVIVSKTAEARFLRAFCYFAMAKRYGGVPIITTPQNVDDPEEALYPARAKEEEVYDFIIAEAEAASADLPEMQTGANLGRPSKYAALALKSRAALYAASIGQFGTVKLNGVVGIPSARVQGYYQKSLEASKAIMDGGKHALYNADADKTTNFRNIFLVKNNPEVIFAKRHDNISQFAGGSGWSIDFINAPRPNGWGRGMYDQAYLELAEAFEYVDGRPGALNRTAIQQGVHTMDEIWGDRDPRFYATLYTQGTSWKGDNLAFHAGLRLPNGTIQTAGSYQGVLATGNQDYLGTGFGMLKYLNESHDNMAGASGNWPDSEQDWQIFRYAEVLLNYAEAAFELGLTSEAVSAINQVRDRAGISLLTSLTREKIHHERRVELAYEGHRYWDVRRWRTAVRDLSVRWSGLRYILDFETKKFQVQILNNFDGTTNIPRFREENYYLPLTNGRTSNNPKLIENPGYQ
ncbi:RagB/SusD family nutrient uptake outer membrane protein [Sphingobacterium corticis]|uniref:RagB/SusD family nutrient uptake outer membrane protein n=1 Tax=Sphingobacterium corticis TaxID=1812823 RepID=A0ABW5NK63_9SPHI